jgi:hypothetical protein
MRPHLTHLLIVKFIYEDCEIENVEYGKEFISTHFNSI